MLRSVIESLIKFSFLNFNFIDRKESADAGIRIRVLTLARSSDNQLHHVHTG